jgi:hypothetical protein
MAGRNRCLVAGLLLIAGLACTCAALAAEELRVGVYYFPGWRNHVLGNGSPTPWHAIHAYPEREPLLGWYDDGEVATVNQQLAWMADYGVGFVVFDWYWNRDLGVLQSQSLAAYLRSQNRNRVPFALLWANHTEAPQDRADFTGMVRQWIDIFRRPEYLRVDGRPVIFIFSTAMLQRRAEAFGASARELLDGARAAARSAGVGELFIVGGAGAYDPTPMRAAEGATTGYDAFSAYNYIGPGTHPYPDGHTESHSFAELTEGYRDQWRWMLSQPRLSFVLPMTTGWDRRPWGGSDDPQHDQSRPTLAEFADHLREGRDALQHNAARTHGLAVICCWNEFGEGSYLEPTRRDGFGFLAAVRDVFGAAASQPGLSP